MAHITWTVQGMTCGHCVNAVEGAARSAAGVSAASVDLEAATLDVDVAGPDFASSVTALVDAVQSQGYELA